MTWLNLGRRRLWASRSDTKDADEALSRRALASTEVPSGAETRIRQVIRSVLHFNGMAAFEVTSHSLVGAFPLIVVTYGVIFDTFYIGGSSCIVLRNDHGWDSSCKLCVISKERAFVVIHGFNFGQTCKGCFSTLQAIQVWVEACWAAKDVMELAGRLCDVWSGRLVF